MAQREGLQGMLGRLPPTGKSALLERDRGTKAASGNFFLPRGSRGGARRPRPQLGSDLHAGVRCGRCADVGTEMGGDAGDRSDQEASGRYTQLMSCVPYRFLKVTVVLLDEKM